MPAEGRVEFRTGEGVARDANWKPFTKESDSLPPSVTFR